MFAFFQAHQIFSAERRRIMEKRRKHITDEVLNKMTTNLNEKKYDPNGMYTGVPADPNEVPVQDADDL